MTEFEIRIKHPERECTQVNVCETMPDSKQVPVLCISQQWARRLHNEFQSLGKDSELPVCFSVFYQ